MLSHMPTGAETAPARLLAHLFGTDPANAHASEQLAQVLGRRLEHARAAWPDIELPDEPLLRHLAEKLSEEAKTPEQVAPALERLRVPELLLACACVGRDAGAIAAFEREYFGEIEAVWHRFHRLPLTLEDVQQRLREKLFLHEPPAVAGYAGIGELRSWVRAAALHMLLNISTRESREQPTDERFFDAVVDADTNAEAAYLKQACRTEFKQAFAASLDRLTSREKTLLRYAFGDGLSVDQIGAIFGVHRATAARWVAKARLRLVEETRAELVSSLHIGEGEAASIVRAALTGLGSTLLRRFE